MLVYQRVDDIVLANPTAIVWTFRAGGAAGINQDNFNGLHRNWFTVNGNCFRIPHRPLETLFKTLVQ